MESLGLRRRWRRVTVTSASVDEMEHSGKRSSSGVYPWSLSSTCLCVVLIVGSLAGARGQQQQSTLNENSSPVNQPKIMTQSGHLIFQTAENHNITFRSSGTGSVIVDGQDLKQLIQMVKENKQRIEELKTTVDIDGRLRTVEERLDRLANLSADEVAQLRIRIAVLENQVNDTNGRRLNRRVSTLEEKVERLNNLLTTNECQTNPCRNGATCVDQYNGFICQCPPGWLGVTCNDDVNECVALANTDLACQNGATCMNTQGSFQCTCQANFFGQRCTETHDDCNLSSNVALCGHGTCQNTARLQPGQPSYRCICDVGWTTSGTNRPICDVDVNECTSGKPPCSVDPPVPCINTPGSFQCAPCPTGFSGNGYTCTDINECLINNGGCSVAPRVMCFNNPGSRTCGGCPDGYVGNGIYCRFVGVCGVNNGGCHQLATCRETPGIVGRSCICPTGYVGTGLGPFGCSPSGGPCASNPCGSNGRCQATTGNAFSCTCNPGWSGTQCNQMTDPCTPNPCMNGGTCSRTSNGLFSCACTSSFTGSTCQQSQDVCGGKLIGEAGSISYPRLSTQTYPSGVNCIWSITTAPTKMLMLTFPKFKLEATPTCSADFLQIHDGLSMAARIIGRYCGMTPPNDGVVNTTHNVAVIWFHSDASVNHDGFEIMWHSVEPRCGGRLIGQAHGVLTSPSYPGLYPNSRDCFWLIVGTPGSTLQFTFGAIDIEGTGQNCTKDYLKIGEGLRESDPVLGVYCGSTNPPPLRTSGPYARVWFHSDSSGNMRGFSMNYAAQPGCGGEYTTDTGVLRSPNYPNPYPHDAQCVWTITVSPGDVITFTFNTIDLEVHGNCNWDYVEVRDGVDETANFVGRFCGNSTPPVFLSTGNVLWIKFRSDASNRGAGFRAQWEVACGGVYTGPTGRLTSPSYPQQYPNDKDCVYLIRPPRLSVISLVFLNFDIESLADTTMCPRDFLEIRSGATADAPLVGTYCGSTLPAPMQQTSTALRLRFKSDPNFRRYGFQLTYTVTETDEGSSEGGSGQGGGQAAVGACGGTLLSTNGTFTSPRHPLNFPHGANCTWIISVPQGHVIRLSYTLFQLEAHVNCTLDYVQVFEGLEMTPASSLGRFCGVNFPPTLTSAGNVLTVRLVSDESIAREGFVANYVALNATTVCGGHLSEPLGELTSPNYPSPYPNSRDCEWLIVMPAGRQILLNITAFNLESHPTCGNDYLEVRNGGFDISPLIGKYCGTTIDRVIRSMSNRLYLRLVTNDATAGTGFRIYYDGTASGCGGDLTGATGSLTSPNYPLAYGQNAECFWNVTVAAGSRVRLKVVDLNLESSASCAYDYLEIRDGGPTGNVVSKLCGNTPPAYVQSTYNRMWIKFRSDSTNHGRGFYATYDTNCNATLSAFRGVIQSPNFPNRYPNGMSCTWTIESTMGSTINASFTSFDVEPSMFPGQPCDLDYVEVTDVQQSTRPIGRYCGPTIPRKITTIGRNLKVRFVSDDRRPFAGFTLSYVTVGCGGELTEASGQLTSPNYPRPYPGNTECIWTIVVAPGNRINITVDDMQMETNLNCTYDVLEILGGSDMTSPSLIRICHTQDRPQTYTSTGNAIVVRFKSDSSNSGRGFSARYDSLPSGCGGVFTARSGYIMSANYPQNYPPNTDCIWSITVQTGHTVEVTFVDFDVEGSTSGCNFDYVALYNTAEFNSSQIARFCGSTVPAAFVRSSGNQMYVRMRTDGSIARKGFRAQYTTGCGGVITADDIGDITSPHYPTTYDPSSNCTWIIRAPRTDNRVTLTFTHMDIDVSTSSTNCTGDYVRVLNGDDRSAPLIGTFCGSSIPAAVTSSGSAMTVIFVSDVRTQRTGFHAEYSSSDSACGGTLVSNSGRFVSPRYPDSYPGSVQCEWTISSSPGNRVLVTFSQMDIEQSEGCENDYIDIQGDAGRHWRLCGTQRPSEQIIGQQLVITFNSNANNSGRGFAAEFSSVFGGSLTGNSGQIASPLYPSLYPHSVDYTWVVTADIGRRLNVTFQSLDIEGSSSCPYDYIKLFDGGSARSRELMKICGMNPPSSIVTSGNQLLVAFHTDSSGTGRGFLLSWTTFDDTAQAPLVPTVNATGTNVTAYACEWTTLNIDCPVDSLIVILRVNYGRLDPSICLNGPNNDTNCSSPSALNLVMSLCAGRQSCAVSASNNLFGDPCPSIHKYLEVQYYCKEDAPSSINCSYSLPFARWSPQTLTSPGYPNGYVNNANCRWTVPSLSFEPLSFEFTDLSLEGSPNCTSDFIALESRTPWRREVFCGSQMPSSPIVFNPPTSSVTVHFHSDALTNSQSLRGFSLKYRTVCGGVRNQVRAAGFILVNSVQYTNNSNCTWTLQVQPGRTIRVIFSTMSVVGTQGTCQGDYVEIFNGESNESPSMGRFCGNSTDLFQPLGYLQSSDSRLTVQFVSDDDGITGNGFRMLYREMATGCGGVVQLSADMPTANVTSIDYPNTYPHNAECTWLITAPAGKRIGLRFEGQFGLEVHSACIFDYVEVRDGTGNNAPLLGKYCGFMTPKAIPMTTDNAMTVKFRTDGSNAEKGFKAVLTFASCGGHIGAANGTLTSPNFPLPYDNGTDCEWFIEGPTGHYLQFRFIDLRLDADEMDDNNCTTSDFVEIRDFNATGPLIARVCRTHDLPPTTLDSSDSTVYVRFYTNSENQGKGFQLSFVSSVEECGGELTTSSGVIASPNFPGLYAHNRRCRWLITAPPGRKVTLTFQYFDIEGFGFPDVPTNDGNMGYVRQQLWRPLYGMCDDYVQVLNGHLPLSPVLGMLCGRMLPQPIESSSNTMVVIFRTDGRGTGRGFQATYTSDNMADCGGELIATDQYSTIESPGFLTNSSYNASQQCIWTIRGRKEDGSTGDSSSIVVRFTELDLEAHGSCMYDFVELREGPDENGQLLDHVCQPDNITGLPVFVTTASSVWIRFVSDFSRPGRGFQLNYTVAACGGVLTNTRGYINSPSSSLIQSGTTDCVWLIQGPSGSQIKLTSVALSLGVQPNCTESYVEVRNGGQVSSPLVGKFCRPMTGVWFSQSNLVRLAFHTDSGRPTDTFRLMYEVASQACGGVIDAENGTISSPNYPNNYNMSIECIWLIQAPSGYHIVATFDELFEINGNSNCYGNYVKVKEPQGDVLLNKTCGTTRPQPITSSGNAMRVKFSSSRTTRNNRGGKGFRMTFAIECGVRLTNSSGTITSPDYPAYYKGGLNCTYDIVGDPQMYTLLRFVPERFLVRSSQSPPLLNKQIASQSGQPGQRYYMMQSRMCRSDYVEVLTQMQPRLPTPQIFDDEDDDELAFIRSLLGGNQTTSLRSVGRFCGSIAPPPFTAMGQMRIRFVTEQGSTDRGWVARYQISQCGGVYTQPSGVIESLSFPDEYPHDINCTWLITVPDGKIVRIRFNKFNLEANSACAYDSVSIYDGQLINASRLIGRYCGLVTPPDITATDSSVVVNFRTDSSMAFGGFSATYDSIYGPKHGCGGILQPANGTVIQLRSPPLGSYTNDMDCLWRMLAPPDQTIVVSITDFYTDPVLSTNTSVELVQIRDGLLPTDPVTSPLLCKDRLTSEGPVTFTSSTNLMTLRLVVNYRNFRGGFVATVDDCTSTEATSSLIAGNFSAQGRSTMRCEWLISAPINQQIEFNVTSLVLNTNCELNYLQIGEFPHLGAIHDIRACNGDISRMHVSIGSAIRLELVMEMSGSTGNQIQLDYKTASCNKVLTAVTGRIVSPRWPSTYPTHSNCEVKVITPPGNRLVLYFALLDIEAHQSCEFDFLQIYNGTDVRSPNTSLATLCGIALPSPIFVGSNSATLRFVTDDSIAKRGYDITYTSSPLGCGGVLTHVNGTFASPEYPGTTTSAITCSWTIRTFKWHLIRLQLIVLPSNVTDGVATSGANCDTSYVTVYNGEEPVVSPSGQSPSQFGRFCTSDNIATLTSNGNALRVVYVAANNSTSNVAFRAYYWSSKGVIDGVQAPVIPSPQQENEDDYDATYIIDEDE